MYQPQLYAEGYQAVKDRIHSYIPQSSVVGMLMYYHPVYTVVESDAVGILQHDAMTWQVRGGHFVCLEGLDMTGRITDEALHSWMAGLDSEARKTFVEVLYTVLEAARIELVTDFTDDWRDRALKMLEALKEIDPDTRRSVRLTLQALFSAWRFRGHQSGAAPDSPTGRSPGGKAQQSGRRSGFPAAGAALGGVSISDSRLPAGNAGRGQQHGRLLRAGKF